MSTFQFIGLATASLLAAWTLTGIISKKFGRVSNILWLIVWSIAGYMLLHPDLTTRIAHFIGIDRGADLLSYLTTLILLIGFFLIYRRYRSIQSQLTMLVRELALLKAESRVNSNADKDSAQTSIIHDSPHRDL